MKILIVPFEKIDDDILKQMKADLSMIFNADVAVLKETPLPNVRWRGDQANVSDFIIDMNEAGDDASVDYVLGITRRDLYDFNNPELNYVFGFSSGMSAIVSTARLEGRFLYNRLSKEAMHELGRCMGKMHCDNPECVMFPPNNVEDIDRKKRSFCDKCAE